MYRLTVFTWRKSQWDPKHWRHVTTNQVWKQPQNNSARKLQGPVKLLVQRWYFVVSPLWTSSSGNPLVQPWLTVWLWSMPTLPVFQPFSPLPSQKKPVGNLFTSTNWAITARVSKLNAFFSNGKHDFGKTNSAHIIPVSFCVTLDSNSAFWEGYKKHKLNDSVQWHSPWKCYAHFFPRLTR